MNQNEKTDNNLLIIWNLTYHFSSTKEKPGIVMIRELMSKEFCI